MDIPPHDHSADRAYAPLLRRGAPQEAAAYLSLNKEVMGRQDGAIPPKYRELLAIAVALTTQCTYCLSSHTEALKKLGGTREELAETAFIAATLRAGAAFTHGFVAMRYFEDAAV